MEGEQLLSILIEITLQFGIIVCVSTKFIKMLSFTGRASHCTSYIDTLIQSKTYAVYSWIICHKTKHIYMEYVSNH